MSNQTDPVNLDSALREQGLRVTSARRRVFELLHARNEPLSAAGLESGLRECGDAIDLVTVYRTLETLERCGLVARVDRLADGWRYTVRNRHHAHSIVCSECGDTAPLDVCGLKRMEQELEQTTGFSNISHALQFYGTCPGCRK
jgi:Fe2+ or Zn2+ uptake regulation protein